MTSNAKDLRPTDKLRELPKDPPVLDRAVRTIEWRWT
jgi:hypothetical protein